MKDKLKDKGWWKTGFLIFTVYTLLTLLYSPKFFSYEQFNNWLINMGQIALANYFWAALTPLVFFAGRRFPVEHPKLVKNLFLHFCLGSVFSIFHTIMFSLSWDLLSRSDSLLNLLRIQFTSLNHIINGLVYYVGILAVHQAIYYFNKYRDREFRLQQAELQTLKMQLHPHFLFNTLNAISALVYSSPKDADRTITQLSELLRTSLQGGKKHEIPLKEELDFLKSYLQIHKTLMENRLEVRWCIDPQTLEAVVPNMLLQPLIENSIQHGLEPLVSGGYIEIKAARQNGNLCLQVRDNGLGLSSNDMNLDSGVGLSNTRARLQYLYGDACDFKLSATQDGGVTVSIKIPFHKITAEN